MNSGSRKRRLEDKATQGAKQLKIMQQDTTEAVNEEFPKILSPEVLDVLPVFANMLDLKSFMGLAMSCKDMYIRCNEDKRIAINVNENKLEVITGRGPPKFAWRLENISRNRKEYLARLQASGALTLKKLCFSDILTATDDHSLQAACDYLRRMRVKNITKLEITGDFLPWNLLPSFIEKFHVKCLEIADPLRIPAEALLSFLSSSLESFRCHETVPVDVLLQVIAPIPRIEFRGQGTVITRNNFKRILSLFQKDHLLNLTIDMNADALHLAEPLPYDHEGLIPDDRPLVFHKRGSVRVEHGEYYFLHSNCDIVKGVLKEGGRLELFKCEKSDYPPILKLEEEAIRNLSEAMKSAMNWRRDDSGGAFLGRTCRASCTFAHFRRFTSNFPVIEPSHKGPIPAERPLFFVGYEGHFWFLSLHDMLIEFAWNNGEASWRGVEVFFWKYPSFYHPALEKYVIKKSFERRFGFAKQIVVENVPKNVLVSVFEEFKELPMEYDGPLPDERPLLFKGRDTHVVLAKDGLIYQCEFNEDYGRLSKCHLSKLPPCLVNEKDVERILKGEVDLLNNIILPTNLETFRGGFGNFKTIPFNHEGPLPEERPLVLVKTQHNDDEVVEQRLVIRESTFVNCEWKSERAVFSKADPQEFPRSLVESLFNHLLKEKSNLISLSLFLKLESIDKCLSSFKVLPFDFDGSVPEDDTVIFTETEIKDGCRLRGQTNDWPEKMMTIWILQDHQELTCVTWGEEEPNELVFDQFMRLDDVPPALKTKEYLKRFLLMNTFKKPDDYATWYGDVNVFLACLNEFTVLPHFFNDELPQGPLVFEIDDEFDEMWGVFREDGSLVTCIHNGEAFILDLSPSSVACPPAIRHLCPSAL